MVVWFSDHGLVIRREWPRLIRVELKPGAAWSEKKSSSLSGRRR